jgi:orotidine-5'-phosphate decarboxylase
MMKAAVEAAQSEASALGLQPPKVIGVTLLTSIDQRMLSAELRVTEPLEDYVTHLARLAQQAGLDGIVASPQEVELIRAACGPDFMIVTPGVRPKAFDTNDQKRVTTPREAVEKGADFIVLGRPITRANDPVAVARAIAAELDGV